jgi:transcriptional regulator with XRE-family HTH domain
MANPKRPTEVGPAGERVAANLAAIRSARDMNQAELAERVSDIGRPMSGATVSKTEKLDRRVDVDDLMAFAVALRTTPNRLLLATLSDHSEVIALAPSVRVRMIEAWDWATGRFPLYYDEECGEDPEQFIQNFMSENAPNDNQEYFMEALRQIHDRPELINQIRSLVQTAVREGVSLEALHSAVEVFGLTATKDQNS